ncbi:MAG: TMEM165/GDT1 family protein [Actinomycetota bacterium]
MSDLLTAFGVVFLAELGDKTQLAAAGFATRNRALPVALGVVVGYVLVSSLSAALGGLAGAALPKRAVNIAAGVLFVVAGIVALRGDEDDEHEESGGVERAAGALIASVAIAIVIAELGDKTMLATVSLAASGNAVLVWVGATIGITSAGLLAVAAGRAIATRLPARTIRLAGGALFIIVGVAILVAEAVG